MYILPFLVYVLKHFKNIAAQQNHRDACFALTAWYLVGSPGVLPQSDTEAYLWAQKAADNGLVKAMYAVGYFLEVGIGTPANMTAYVNLVFNFKTSLDNGTSQCFELL